LPGATGNTVEDLSPDLLH